MIWLQLRVNGRSSIGLRWASSSAINQKLKWEKDIKLPRGPPLKLSTGKLAKLADGSVVASIGSTSVLATAVCKSPAPGSSAQSTIASFVPLTVDYRQKTAAAGRIPTTFLRREGGPSEREILTSRLVDRSVRPLFPKGFGHETQVVCNLLSVDGVHDPDVTAINAASAALSSSNIPWNGPVGAVRVGHVDDRIVVNPTRKEMQRSKLNLVVTGTVDKRVLMLESEAAVLDRELFLEAVEQGLDVGAAIAAEIKSLCAAVQKRELPAVLELPVAIIDDMRLLAGQKLRAIFYDRTHDKTSRDLAIFSVRDEAIAMLRKEYPDTDASVFYECFNRISRDLAVSLALDEGVRVDGRGVDELRKITCESDLHSPLHGSALFTRGQTQVLCTVALDSIESSLKSDPVSVMTGALKEKNFFVHYEFPPYATNEIGRTAVGRRELGHGALAEKALRAVVPKDFPFAIRLTSEVLESNGSSSMATVCGGTLALLDAGVPLVESAAGVAVGLMSRRDGEDDSITEHAVLLDILGMEDYIGDMDFKVAGTSSGITALQLDVKVPGLPFKIIRVSTEKGHAGIKRILDIMADCRHEARTDKTNLPVCQALEVPPQKRARFVGAGGINVRRIVAETGVQLTQVEEGSWSLFAPNQEAMAEAREMIDDLLKEDKPVELVFGAIYNGKIVEIKDRGVMLELQPGTDPVLVHNTQLSATKISHPSALGLLVGQDLMVKYYGRDPVTGAVRLSRKVLTLATTGAVKQVRESTTRR